MKKSIHVTMEDDILIYLDFYAKRYGMSRSAYITMLVTDVMEEERHYYEGKMPIGYGYCEEY